MKHVESNQDKNTTGAERFKRTQFNSTSSYYRFRTTNDIHIVLELKNLKIPVQYTGGPG